MKNIPRFLLLIAFFLTSFFGNANSPTKQDKPNLVQKISFIKDNHFDKNSIQKQLFTPIENPRISHENGVYWFKIELDSLAISENLLVFDFIEPSIKEVTLFSNSSLIATKQASLWNSSITIEVNKPVSIHYYVKALFKRQVHFPLTVMNSANFTSSKNSFFLKAGLYYGLSFMVFIINLIFFVSLKDRTYLYYCCFLAMLNLAYTGFDGICYWIFSLENSDFYIILTHYIIQVSGVLFAAKFLNLKTHQPKANIIGTVVLILNFVMYATFFITDDFLFCAIGDLIGMSILTYYWFLGLLTLKKETSAIFFVIGYVMVLFVAIFFLIPLNFGLSFMSLSLNHLKIGALVEMLILTYAITYRVQKMQKQSIQIQFEIGQHLKHILQLEEKLDSKGSNSTNLNQKIENLTKRYNLTDREADVLQLISQGYNQSKIAESLFISINTVKFHSRNLYEKLDVKNKTEITAKLLVD
tara:strand:- start:34790 stop:36199 length:1410 start_codon:yes stop_codon:yes gene_type:complete